MGNRIHTMGGEMKITMRTIKTTFLALAVLLLALPGAATAANFDITSYSSGYTIKAWAPGADGTGWRRIESTGGQFITDIEGLGSGVAYCLDPWQSVGTGQHNYDWFGTPSNADSSNTTILTSLGGLQAAYLVSTYSPVLNDAGTGTKDELTAMQLALWEVVFDTEGGYDVNTGNFRLAYHNGLSSSIIDRANYLLSTVPTSFTPEQVAYLDTYFRVGGDSGMQDLVGGVAGSAQTPEPGTMLLLGSALLGSGLISRRRRKEEDDEEA